jgi:hypothetical protein
VVSAAEGGSSRKTARPSNAQLVAAARASASHLFSIFPGVMGKKRRCVLSPGWGVTRRMPGVCAMWIKFVHTPAFVEAQVSFNETWPRGDQTWTVIERWVSTGGGAPKIQVLNTLWHGSIAGSLGR